MIGTETKRFRDEIVTTVSVDAKGYGVIATVTSRWAYASLLMRRVNIIGTTYDNAELIASAFAELNRVVSETHPDPNLGWTYEDLVRDGYFTS